jgi:hypothetical protein
MEAGKMGKRSGRQYSVHLLYFAAAYALHGKQDTQLQYVKPAIADEVVKNSPSM